MPNTLTYFPVTGDYRNVADPVISGTTNVPDLEIIEGFVTFYPRLPVGFVAYIDDFVLATNVNQVVTITLVNAAGGTFTLTFGTQTTTDIAWNAPATGTGSVQSALAALSNIGAGNVAVAGSAGGPYTVTFQGALANQYLTGIEGDEANLTGSNPAVQTPTTTPGSAAASRDTAVAIPPRKGRIWNGTLSTIDITDTPGVELVANSPALALQEAGFTSLIYDVQYSAVTYNKGPQTLKNFAFVAPVDSTSICITDPALSRLDYVGPP
jgi:hypothetical protein